MTTIKLFTINCDAEQHAPGCPMWVGNEDTAAKALTMARQSGWTSERLGGMRNDYSPHCWRRMHKIGVR